MSFGETDLNKLLAHMVPQLHEGEYVFCSVDTAALPAVPLPDPADIICSFREEEGPIIMTIFLCR